MRRISPVIEIEIPASNAESNNNQLDISTATQPIRQRIDDLFQHQGIVVVGIGGGSATGKTSLFPQIIADKHDHVLISQDDYCIGNKRSTNIHGQPNLYTPEDFQVDLIAQHITSLKEGEEISKPTYSYKAREPDGHECIKPHPLIALEGEFPLHDTISPTLDIGIFIDTDDHSRFIRRMIRPRRNPKQADMHRILEYFSLAFPFYHSHILPTRKNADVILTNRYNPHEGNERLETVESEITVTGNDSLKEAFHSTFPDADTQQYRYTYYTHPCCTRREIVAMLQHQKGSNEMMYSSQSNNEGDGLVVSPSVFFQVDDEMFDLNNIGYRKVGIHEGTLSTTSRNSEMDICFYESQGRQFLRFSARSTKGEVDTAHSMLHQHAQTFLEKYTVTHTGIHHIFKGSLS